MQNERDSRDLRDPFGMFGGLGSFRGSGSSIFGRNPFHDPFFSHPFGSIFDQSDPVGKPIQATSQNELVIQELGSDDEEEMETNEEDGDKSADAINEPFVDHPDDETNDSDKQTYHRTYHNRIQGSQPQTFKVHSCKVTYGGINGAYYTSSATRRMGNDGVIMEECKEADKTTGEATHRISRGLQNKGHSVTRKLNSNGNVDTLQTLHNLNEDELGNFEEAWNGNFGRHMSPWMGGSSGGVDPMSNSRHNGDSWGWGPNNASKQESSSARPRNVLRIPIE